MYFKSPEKKHVDISRVEGQFNLFSSENQAQYGFTFPDLSPEQTKELGFSTWYTISLDEDYGWEDYTALECAYELKQLYDGYFIHSRKEDVNKLVGYLELIEEEQELLREQYEVEYAKSKIEYWESKLEQLLK